MNQFEDIPSLIERIDRHISVTKLLVSCDALWSIVIVYSTYTERRSASETAIEFALLSF